MLETLGPSDKKSVLFRLNQKSECLKSKFSGFEKFRHLKFDLSSHAKSTPAINQPLVWFYILVSLSYFSDFNSGASDANLLSLPKH
jgi:hypothetical protein